MAANTDQHYQTRRCAYFGFDEDRVALDLEEKQKCLPRTSGQRPLGDEWKYTRQLTLRIDRTWGSGLRATWSDGKRQRLENILNSVVTCLLKQVDYKKQQRLDQEIATRQRQREANRRRAADKKEADQQQQARGAHVAPDPLLDDRGRMDRARD